VGARATSVVGFSRRRVLETSADEPGRGRGLEDDVGEGVPDEEGKGAVGTLRDGMLREH